MTKDLTALMVGKKRDVGGIFGKDKQLLLKERIRRWRFGRAGTLGTFGTLEPWVATHRRSDDRWVAVLPNDEAVQGETKFRH